MSPSLPRGISTRKRVRGPPTATTGVLRAPGSDSSRRCTRVPPSARSDGWEGSPFDGFVGVAVAWVVLPFAVSFLLSFATDDLTPLIAADRYFGFVGSLMLVFGLATEYPILLVFLSRVGVVTSAKLRRWRRNALVLAVVVGAFATPETLGCHPVYLAISPIVLGVVLYLLYELSIWLVRAGGR